MFLSTILIKLAVFVLRPTTSNPFQSIEQFFGIWLTLEIFFSYFLLMWILFPPKINQQIWNTRARVDFWDFFNGEFYQSWSGHKSAFYSSSLIFLFHVFDKPFIFFSPLHSPSLQMVFMTHILETIKERKPYFSL